MARPISLELPPRDPREELRKRLEEAPIEHAEALLDSYELLQQLHDHGVLELLRGALGASDKLIEAAVDAANSDESVRAIRNAIILGKMLGSINPEVLQCFAIAAGRNARVATRSRSSSRQDCSRSSASSATRNCAEALPSSTAFLRRSATRLARTRLPIRIN